MKNGWLKFILFVLALAIMASLAVTILLLLIETGVIQ